MSPTVKLPILASDSNSSLSTGLAEAGATFASLAAGGAPDGALVAGRLLPTADWAEGLARSAARLPL